MKKKIKITSFAGYLIAEHPSGNVLVNTLNENSYPKNVTPRSIHWAEHKKKHWPTQNVLSTFLMSATGTMTDIKKPHKNGGISPESIFVEKEKKNS